MNPNWKKFVPAIGSPAIASAKDARSALTPNPSPEGEGSLDSLSGKLHAPKESSLRDEGLHPTVSIVIVTRNSAACVGSALASIRRQTYPADRLHTVVVDNGSSDGTVTLIRKQFPWVTLLSERNNQGFAGGCNIGMRAQSADYYALINPDAEIAPDWITTLVAVMEADRLIGVGGSKIYYGNSRVIQHAGGVVRANALTLHLGDQEVDHGQYDTQRDVDYVMGAALLIWGETARALDFLPEVYYPAYYEEVDFCTQVRRSGQRVVYVPEAVAHHADQKRPNSALSIRFLRLYHKQRYLYALRNMTTPEQRRAFRDAERLWRGQYSAHVRMRLLLSYCTLINWRWLIGRWWLLSV